MAGGIGGIGAGGLSPGVQAILSRQPMVDSSRLRSGMASGTDAGPESGAGSGRMADKPSVGSGFEALLAREMVKALRKTVPKSEGATSGGEIYDHFIEDALSTHLAESGDLGIAKAFDTPINALSRPASTPYWLAGATSGTPFNGSGLGGNLNSIADEKSLKSAGPSVEKVGAPSEETLADDLPPGRDPWVDAPDPVMALERYLRAAGEIK